MSLINSMLMKLEKKIGNPKRRILNPPTDTSSIDPVSKFNSKMNTNQEDLISTTEAGDPPFFGSDSEFSYAVKINGIDNKFPTMSFGRALPYIRQAKEFEKSAKSDEVNAKGKSTLAAVKSWVKDNKPSEFFAKWRKDSKFYKDDGVTIYYKLGSTTESKSKKTEAGKLIITPDQLDALKAAYKDAPSSIVPGTPNYMKVMALLNVFDLNSVKKIALANIPTLSKLAKELVGDKTEAAELLKTGLDTDMHDHDHEFYLGDDRTQTGGDGHDHAMIYHNGKPVKTGPAPDDGHIHEIDNSKTESIFKKKNK